MSSLADLINKSASKKLTQEAPLTESIKPEVAQTNSSLPAVDLSALVLSSGTKAVTPSEPQSSKVETKPSFPVSNPALQALKLPGEIDIESVATQTGKLSEEQGLQSFLDNMHSIPELYENPEILSSQIRSIMEDLQDNPHFIDHICVEDIGLMVRGMREALGVAQIKKSAAKSKRTGSTSKSSVMKNAMSEMLADMGGLQGIAKLKI